MINNEFLKELSNRISRLMPMASNTREEVQRNIQDVLQGTFARLNLVTRDEFDAQLKVLERAQHTISALEEKITALEQAQGINPGSGSETEKQ